MNNVVFGKTMENVRKRKDVKLVKADKRTNQLASEPDYHTTKYFSETLIAMEMKKIKVRMNKRVYLGVSILDLSKTLMYEFWYDYIKPKYQRNCIQRKCAQGKTKLCYMDIDSFVIHIKTKDFYEDIANDVEKWFDASNYNEDICNSIDKRPLPIRKNKKVIGLFKDELGGKIMIESAELTAKTYAYLMGDNSKHKKAKGTKKCVTKSRLMFENYTHCLFNDKIILKSQQRFKRFKIMTIDGQR